MRRILLWAARRFPSTRRLIKARDTAISERDTAITERNLALREAPHRIVGVASPETYLQVKLNGARLRLPRDTVRTMYHCAAWETDDTLSLCVETAHLTWMIERTAAGGTFLDVAASTGVITLPVWRRFGNAVSIIAYEPVITARELLRAAWSGTGSPT